MAVANDLEEAVHHVDVVEVELAGLELTEAHLRQVQRLDGRIIAARVA